ncbi:exported hypothetical protein [uncultured Paludibacter sp.]|uniref:DUF4252 domain-containing protein n=1 Tax=uncultured Paludibacter sp. TaxID=497635 RepID=A0A653AKN9_9BACT|nr:exported hypothetical protein [uncultured Paludibacter sp.]
MKKINLLLIIIVALSATTVKAQNLDRFFNKYAKDNNFQYTAIDNTSDLSKNKKIKGVSKLLKKVEGVKVLKLNITNDNAPLANEFARDIYSTFTNKKFETIVSNDNEDGNVNILKRVLKDKQTDIIVINKEGKEIILIWLKGDVNES